MVNGLVIDKLLTIDDTGMPKAPYPCANRSARIPCGGR